MTLLQTENTTFLEKSPPCVSRRSFAAYLPYVVIVFLTLRLNYVDRKENILLMNEIGNYEERKCHLVCDINFLTASIYTLSLYLQTMLH
jgi:hypothetical protein